MGELAQRACAMKVGVSVVEVERNGMNALNLYVNVEHGKSSRAVSPGRAGGVKAFASNIDVHGVRGIQAGYQKDQPQQQQQQQQPQQQQRGGEIESMSAAELKQVLYSHYSTAGNLSQEDRQVCVAERVSGIRRLHNMQAENPLEVLGASVWRPRMKTQFLVE